MIIGCCSGEVTCDCSGNRENKMCKLTKPQNKFDMAKVMPLVNKPRFVCQCCGRLANEAENLCRPLPLEKGK